MKNIEKIIESLNAWVNANPPNEYDKKNYYEIRSVGFGLSFKTVLNAKAELELLKRNEPRIYLDLEADFSEELKNMAKEMGIEFKSEEEKNE